MVAGGPSEASDRRILMTPFSRLRQESRTNCVLREFSTRLRPESKNTCHVNRWSRFARDHRLIWSDPVKLRCSH